jgi:hypothetical protein
VYGGIAGSESDVGGREEQQTLTKTKFATAMVDRAQCKTSDVPELTK